MIEFLLESELFGVEIILFYKIMNLKQNSFNFFMIMNNNNYLLFYFKNQKIFLI